MNDQLRLICESEGVFLRREAIQAGYSDKAIAVQRRSGQWHRIRHGIYCFSDIWTALTPEEQHLTHARGILRVTPGKVMLSHTTALLAHGIAVWGMPLDRIHLTRIAGGPARLERDVVHHVGSTRPAERLMVNGLPVIAPARAVLESAARSNTEAGLVAADSALHLGKCTREELEETYRSMLYWPDTNKLHLLMYMADALADSAGESRMRHAFWRQGLPKPVLQYPVRDETGRLIAILDFAWPEHRLWAEFDGRLKYGRLLRPGETAGDAVFREKRREDRVRELLNWRCARVTWDELDRPIELGIRMRRLMGFAA